MDSFRLSTRAVGAVGEDNIYAGEGEGRGRGGTGAPLYHIYRHSKKTPEFKTDIHLDGEVNGGKLQRMSNIKAEGTQKKQILVGLSPAALLYANEKGQMPAFRRGKRGGRSQAIEAMIMFSKGYEELNQ